MRDWIDEHNDYGTIIDERNVLLYLAQWGQIDRVRELIERGYDVNIDDDGFTPAHLAAKRNDFAMLQLLAEAGADLADGCTETITPLFWARHHGNKPMADYITAWLARAGK